MTLALALGTVLAFATGARADDARCARRFEKLQIRIADGTAPTSYGDTGCANVEEFLLSHGYERETRMKVGMLAAGVGVFGGTYLMSAIGGAMSSGARDNPWAPMMIPVAGPFITAGNMFSMGSHDAYGFIDDFVGVFLVIDGLAQISGLALAVAGASSTKNVFVREPRARLHVAPMVGKQSTGLSLSLAF